MAKKKLTPKKKAAPKTKKKQKPTKSWHVFESVAKRSLNLITLQSPVERILGMTPKLASVDLSDMTRASVVLAVAAMDAYFTDVFAERFVPYLKEKGPGKSLVKFLESAGLDTSVALELLTMKRPYRRVRTLVESHLELKTTQRRGVIDDLFLCYGLRDFCSRIEKLKGRKTLLTSVETLVTRRHKIAHEGDLNSHRRLNGIDPVRTRKRIKDVIDFVSGADEILQRQLPV